MTKPCIDIVLASYNGERFIEQQITSIQRSSRYAELVARLIVVDDGSTDNTHTIIARLLQSDARIEWHVNPGPEHGPRANFNYGLTLTSADWIMLCDQDDVWHSEKIARSYTAIGAFNQPALLFSDKRVVDENLTELCPSFFRLRNISRQWHHSTERLLQQNVASGCTMLFNRALLEIALPIPQAAFMHDWWLILVAKLNGQIVFIDEALIDYRQHSSNSLGAKSHSVWYLVCHFVRHLQRFERNFWHAVDQAEALEHRFGVLQREDIPFARLRHYTYWQRLQLFCRGRVGQHSWKGQVALLLTLLKPRK